MIVTLKAVVTHIAGECRFGRGDEVRSTPLIEIKAFLNDQRSAAQLQGDISIEGA